MPSPGHAGNPVGTFAPPLKPCPAGHEHAHGRPAAHGIRMQPGVGPFSMAAEGGDSDVGIRGWISLVVGDLAARQCPVWRSPAIRHSLSCRWRSFPR